MTIARASENDRVHRRAHGFRSLRAVVLALLLAGLLLGCGGGGREEPPPPPPPPPPPKTEVRLVLAAAPEVNPDPTGRPSPIAVRVLRLSGTRAFNEADFFQLDRDPAASLGRELVGETRFVLNPGDVRLIEAELAPEERFIGVVAAYRDVARSNWRAAVAIPRDRVTTLSALLGQGGVQLTVAER